MSTDPKPRVLIVYFSLTQQSARVAATMEEALTARGCAVTQASLEFTDERWAPEALEVPDGASLPPDREHPACAATPQDG